MDSMESIVDQGNISNEEDEKALVYNEMENTKMDKLFSEEPQESEVYEIDIKIFDKKSYIDYFRCDMSR
jgi:hypothetical protein